MSLRRRQREVQAAVAACAEQRRLGAAAWDAVKVEIGKAASPGRVLGVGLLGGFLAGVLTPAAKASDAGLGGRLLRLLLDGAFGELRAAIAAGAAMAEAEADAGKPAPAPADG